MISEILMPQGGQDLTTGRIVRWLVKEGESVKSGEVICEVETEKAVFEVTSPVEGYFLKKLAEDDQEVEILSVIGYVGDKNEKIPSNQSGEQQVMDNKSLPNTAAATPLEIEPTDRSPLIKISPKARKLARDHQISLSELKSSTSDGKITSEDVLRVINDHVPTSPENGRVVHPEKMRQTIASRLSESWQTTPHIFVTVEVDMTHIVEQQQSRVSKEITINDLIIFACAKAILEFPEINASFHDSDTIYYWEDVNIGVAVSTGNGLIVPVLEDVDRLTIQQLAVKSKDIIEKAREGKQVFSKPSRFTISNLGMYNVESFTAIINPPESAILAVSTIIKRPVVDDKDHIIARNMMKMTLSLDHRVGDGVLAAEFLNEIKRLLENYKFS